MSVVILGSVKLVVPVGENVTMKFRSIANGMTTGTIGTTALKRMEVHHTLLVVTEVHLNLHQQTRDTPMMYLVVTWTNTKTSFRNMNTASAAIHIHVTSVK